jgi:MFS family permease
MVLSSDRDTHEIRVVYLATLLLGVAYGVSISLTSLHLDARHFSKASIGSLAAVFALGIILFSIPIGRLVERFSAKRTLFVAMVGYGCAVTAFPWLTTWGGVAVARFFDGAFSVGIWVSCETILLARAAPTKKASVTSLYAIAMSIGYVVGPILAKGITAVASMPIAFAVSGVLALTSACVVFALLGADASAPRVDAPTTPAIEGASTKLATAATHASALALFVRIKCSCFATFAYGYFQASVVLFLPLYLVERKGITREQTILVPAFFAAGMLLFSNAAGRIGDRFGHLLVMRVLAFVGMWMITGFVFLGSYPAMCGAVFVAGATLASISPVSLALQGVVVPPGELGRSNSIYNVFYAAGMLLGPPISSALYTWSGGPAMLEHLAGLFLVFVLFTWFFKNDDPAARKGRGAAELASAGSAERTAV